MTNTTEVPFDSAVYSYQIFLATIIPSIIVPLFLVCCCCGPIIFCICISVSKGKSTDEDDNNNNPKTIVKTYDYTQKWQKNKKLLSVKKLSGDIDILNKNVRKLYDVNNKDNIINDSKHDSNNESKRESNNDSKRESKRESKHESTNDILIPIDSKGINLNENNKETKTTSVTPSTTKVHKIAFIHEINSSTTTDGVSEFVNTILTQDTLPDMIVVLINSPGGSVIEYGLMHNELQRLIDAKIRLVVCVDKVAASGGYLIACNANHIVASSLSVIGSIGVLAQYTNFKEVADKIGVKIETISSGKHKVPYDDFGVNTDEQMKYIKDEMDATHQIFKDIVKKYRPNIDMDKIGTGAHWYGVDALKIGLIDELATSSEYLMKISSEYQLTTININEKKTTKGYISKLFKMVNENVKLLKYNY